MMSTTLGDLCHNLVKDGGRRATGEGGEGSRKVGTGGAGVPQEALRFFGSVGGAHCCQEGCTGLTGDVCGKVSDAQRSDASAMGDPTTEAVGNRADRVVVRESLGVLPDFKGVSLGEQNRRHGGHLGAVGHADSHREQGSDAEDGEDGHHVEHITGGRVQVKGFRGESFSHSKGNPYSIRYSWGFSKWAL